MGMTADRKFDWITALSVALGAAVIGPSLAVLVINLIAVATSLL